MTDRIPPSHYSTEQHLADVQARHRGSKPPRSEDTEAAQRDQAAAEREIERRHRDFNGEATDGAA